MVDNLKRYIHEDGNFKVSVVETSETGRTIFKNRDLTPIALQLLTQALTGAVLITTSLKGQGTLSLSAQGDGPMGHLTAEANTQGQVRGLVGNPGIVFEPEAGKGLFEQAVGKGNLTVKRRTQPSDTVYQSVVPLVNGEMALNLAHYLHSSEQIRSAVQLGVNLDPDQGVKGAGGIFIQALPNANEHLFFILEDRLGTMDPLGTLFSEADGHQPIYDWLFEGMKVKELSSDPVAFHCSCTKQRILQVMASLPENDLQELSDNQTLTVNCSFCNKPFSITPQEMQTVLEWKREQSQD